MTEDSMMQAWGWYLLGVAGFMVVWWRITRGLRQPLLRRMVRLLLLVLLVCPYSVGEGYSEMAPALLMLSMETVFEGAGAFMRVGPTLLGVALVSLLLHGLLEWGLSRRRQQAARQAELDEDREQLLGQSRAAAAKN